MMSHPQLQPSLLKVSLGQAGNQEEKELDPRELQEETKDSLGFES